MPELYLPAVSQVRLWPSRYAKHSGQDYDWIRRCFSIDCLGPFAARFDGLAFSLAIGISSCGFAAAFAIAINRAGGGITTSRGYQQSEAG